MPVLKIHFLKFIAIGFLVCGAVFACRQNADVAKNGAVFLSIEGKTMGTSFHVQYRDSLNRDFQNSVDSLLKAVNHEISTYEANSYISKFNQVKTEIPLIDEKGKAIAPHFLKCWKVANEIFQKTGGAFDPTVMPLVNYWGFGYTEHKAISAVDSLKIDSIVKNQVGLTKIGTVKKNGITYLAKSNPTIELDFGGIGQGYGVDAIADFLEARKIPDFLVELGGELRSKGKNETGEDWLIGINIPKEDAALTAFYSKVYLKNTTLSTSGNYRNYYEVDGVKYSHTINPTTGFPEKNNLLSASIFAKDCTTADALATACMVLGTEKAISAVSRMDGIQYYFIVSKNDGTLAVEMPETVANWMVK